jgi:hypothetical protein
MLIVCSEYLHKSYENTSTYMTQTITPYSHTSSRGIVLYNHEAATNLFPYFVHKYCFSNSWCFFIEERFVPITLVSCGWFVGTTCVHTMKYLHINLILQAVSMQTEQWILNVAESTSSWWRDQISVIIKVVYNLQSQCSFWRSLGVK